MPEISEVKLTAEFVTQTNKNRVIENVSFLRTNKLKLIEEIDLTGKKISAKSRGKELKLFFDAEPVVISLGMTGCFKNFEKSQKHKIIKNFNDPLVSLDFKNSVVINGQCLLAAM